MKIDVSHLTDLKPPKTVTINAVDYNLYKSINDPSVPFAYNHLVWLNTGCEKISDLPELHYCWIRGVVPPTPNTMEKPMDIMLLGFTRSHINMQPQFLTVDHLKKMFIYKADAVNFTESFLQQFIGIPPIQEAEPMLDLEELGVVTSDY